MQVRCPIQVEVQLRSHHDELLELSVEFDALEAFMYAGDKKASPPSAAAGKKVFTGEKDTSRSKDRTSIGPPSALLPVATLLEAGHADQPGTQTKPGTIGVE